MFSEKDWKAWNEMVNGVVDHYQTTGAGRDGIELSGFAATVDLVTKDNLAGAVLIHLLIHRAAGYTDL